MRNEFQFIIKGTQISIRHACSQLETIADFLEKNFSGLNIKQLPEYRGVIDAIEKYSATLTTYLQKKFEEEKATRGI